MTTNLGARISLDATLTIAINASVSDAVDMQDYAGGKLLIPVDFQGYIHFEVSHDGATYAPLVDEFGAAIVIT